MSKNPSIVIVSSSSTKPKSLIKLITKCTDIVEDPADANKIMHSWKIDTKYYTAEVDIIGINQQFIRNESFNDNVEALIIHMDSNKETGLEDLAAWTSLENDCDPEIKLLVANYCTNDTKITNGVATEWCLKRGFEFIELYPTEKPCDQEIIEEKIGVDRIVEALQMHTWSNMMMKNQSKVDELQLNEYQSETSDSVLANDDFSDLFAQLSMMKESLQSLPMNQRKQCAEQVVTAFWKAIGGDEEEISDL